MFRYRSSSICVNIYSMIIGEQKTDFQKLTGIRKHCKAEEWRFYWNQGEIVEHFIWIGESYFVKYESLCGL